MEVTITPVKLFGIPLADVMSMGFTGENPFFDKDEHGFTDGPRYFLEAARVREGVYGDITPASYFFDKEFDGYRLDGYVDEMARIMGRCGVYLYMGNLRLGYALIDAPKFRMEKLKLALDSLV